jgi:hypothetical protein
MLDMACVLIVTVALWEVNVVMLLVPAAPEIIIVSLERTIASVVALMVKNVGSIFDGTNNRIV